jgi:phosphinothricin acetyltransferase
MTAKPNPLSVIVRPCFEQDVQSVQFIYAHHVLHGTASFELEAPDLAEMRRRWTDVVAGGWPFLVACPENDPTRVLGYAYAGAYHKRPAYAKTVENSVYVAANAARRGVGTNLLSALVIELAQTDVREIVAMIGDRENEASIALHKKLSFHPVGILTGVGFKFGRWLDVVMMQRTLRRAE